MSLELYSTLSRRKQVFEPINAGEVKMYVCGVTVYDYTHIGHGRTFISFDIIRRWLEASGFKVTFVRNITDVDDKIIRRAAERHVTCDALTDEFARAMQEDMLTLGCLAPTVEPRATHFIPQMLNIIDKLEKKGLAYQTKSGDVAYAVRQFKDYGKLSGKSIDDLISGERVAADESKRDPLDFVLWKSAKPGEPQWDSPWGKGRPGWHIECSAMSCHYLGETFDIHGGGPDLIFPHHENEIAQSEGANGKRFANYWMHTGPLRVMNKEGKEEKMSKSLGNFWTVRDAIAETDDKFGKGNGAQVLRFFLMRTHYRSPILFGPDLIVDAYQSLKRLYTALKDVPADNEPLDWNEECAKRFAEAMNDDFNVPVAVAQLFELANRAQAQKSAAMSRQLKKLGAILNILQGDPEAFLKGSTEGLDEAAIEEAIAARAAAKKAKDYAKADEIRKHLAQMGVMLTDTPQGTTWQRVLVEKAH
ncbi:cysteine--tRNA ligase [Parasutterella secunda]|uniref:Cysteine--tRNA ligase n=1 Tax=Parasutterella secunda TaxID=626947 RepID=A0ABS2GTI2_9BURK|nr:cysteine--tRNA ligase [Parasutterella secunda]MBM6928121.1 cysteine--tRNA ligase [Parasutterella secunda]